jgi:hypothetical protein
MREHFLLARKEYRRYVAEPRDHGRALERPLGPTLVLDDAVVLAHWTGVLALARSDGRPLLDYKPRDGDAPSMPFDDAHLEIVAGADRCFARADGGRFLAECGGRVLFFDGRELAVFQPSGRWPLVGRSALTVTSTSARGDSFTARARVAHLEISMSAFRSD